MSTEQALKQRSNNCCELCTSDSNLVVYDVPPSSDGSAEQAILVCDKCLAQINGSELDGNHWRCLNDSMWSQVPAVQVMAYRMLHRLSGESWAQDLLDMLYLDDETKAWADAGLLSAGSEDREAPTLDSNSAELHDGDTVTLIKDLVVKGTGFTAKRGTAVRNISLTSNPEQIEGKINGTKLVLLSCYMKKA